MFVLRRVRFSLLAGPDHIGVMLSPVPGVALDRWSLVDQEPLAGPKWNGRDTYFVYYAYASEPEPLTFSFDLKVSKDNQICHEMDVNCSISGITKWPCCV